MSSLLTIKELKRKSKKTGWPNVTHETFPKATKLYDSSHKPILFNSNGAAPWCVLSNFSGPGFIAQDLITKTTRWWATVEHWYQFHKLALVDENEKNFNDILVTYNPSVAKFKSSEKNNAVMVEGWEDGLKDQVMLIGCRHKASQSVQIYETLKESGTRLLVENAYWDAYWGTGRDGNGENRLGITWMKVRQEINTNMLKLKKQSAITKLVQKLKENFDEQ